MSKKFNSWEKAEKYLFDQIGVKHIKWMDRSEGDNGAFGTCPECGQFIMNCPVIIEESGLLYNKNREYIGEVIIYSVNNPSCINCHYSADDTEEVYINIED